MRICRLLAALGPALLVAACDVAPLYQAPSMALPSHYKDAGVLNDGSIASVYDAAFWRAFHDRGLDSLETQVDTANQDLAAAVAAYDRARAYALAAESGLYPYIEADGMVSANKQSANRPLRSANQPTYYGANQIDAQASYEVDIWGRVRDIVNAAKADAQANADSLAQARLSLHAELARDYVNLRSLDLEAKLIADTISNYRDALALTQSRLAGQIASPIDVARAEVQLNNVQAEASDLALRRSSLENAIATLIGKPASSFSVPRASDGIAFPRRPRSVPSDLLRRRPDVAESERLVAAANERIGVAKAAFYPRFTIDLLGGTQDTGFNLLSAKNTMYTIGPSVSLPLFDAGLRQADLEAAKAAYTEAAARYRGDILRAVQEVEDNLSALRWLTREAGNIDASAVSARRASELSMALYRDGAVTYLDVVTAQNAALDAERASLILRARRLEADVGLMLALGGGWTIDQTASADDQ
jgi:outer membrane protein, multidrug efflux system